MATTILEILQQRVQTLGKNMAHTEAKIKHLHEQMAHSQTRLSQAQQEGDVASIRECLGEQQQLQEQIPKLQKTLANIQKSYNLFERQLQQNTASATEH